MATTEAWLLYVNDATEVAVGQRELVYLEQSPVLHDFPGAPSYCRHLLLWQRRLLPAMNLALWSDRRAPETSHWPLAAIIAYQSKGDDTPRYGALLLERTPRILEVHGAQGCRLPAELQAWASVAKACFRTVADQAIPVIDFAALFEPPSAVQIARASEHVQVA